jgi:hypothetical protein
MPKKEFERRKVLDPVVADLLAGMEQRQTDAQLPRRTRQKKAREREKIQSRREQRATYDLPPSLRTSIKEMAEQHNLPISQLVSLAILRFLKDVSSHSIDLGIYKKPSHSPKFDWVLDLSGELEKLKKEGIIS